MQIISTAVYRKCSHGTTQRRQSRRRATVLVLCTLLLIQGSPAFALQEGWITARPEIPDWLPGMPTAAEISIPSPNWQGAWQRGRWELEMLGATLWSVASQDGSGGGSSEKPTKPPTMPKTKVEPPTIPPFDPSTLESVSPPLEAITLVPGWNFVSILEQPDDTSAASVLAPIEGKYFKVWAVDNCDTEDPWKLYQPSDLASSDLETIDPTKGMWIKSLEVVDLPSTGTMAQKTSIHLCPGWNLIGFPLPQIRTLPEAMRPFEGKYRRIMTYDATATRSQWDVYSTDVPEWGNDLWEMKPGRAYWVLATEEVTAEFINEGPPPEVELFTPDDLTVVTEPIEVLGAVRSIFLDHWTLRHRPVGEAEWTDWATGDRTTELYNLAYFDPTLLLNGLYEIQLTAVDWAGQTAESEIRVVSVEGNMKIGNFTLSFVDLAVPVSGLDLEIIRTYDSRDKLKRDFGVGWSLDIRQGSYRNNRAPGDGWQLAEGFLPCDSSIESKAHVTTIRLSDREIYRFALRLVDGLSSTGGGCYAHAEFEYVDGPIPGATLEILGNIRVFQETRSSDRVLDLDTLQTFEPQNVRLTTRDKRIFDLDLDIGVTRVEDPNGNRIDITDEGIFHSVGKAIKFERDDAGRIIKIIDPMEYEYLYSYDEAGDLVMTTDPHLSKTKFGYDDDHRIIEIIDPRGTRAVRSEYDVDGRLIKVTDARGRSIELKHDLDKNREVIANRLGHARIFEYDRRGNVVAEIDELGHVTKRTYDGKDRLLTETDPLENTTTNIYNVNGDLESITDPLGHVTSFEHNPQGDQTKIIDTKGNATLLAYDDHGNLNTVTDVLGAITVYTYNEKGDISSIVDGMGFATTFQHSRSGDLISVTDSTGNTEYFQYNANGSITTKKTTQTRQDGSKRTLETKYSIDALGRPTSITLPDGTTSKKLFDPMGAVILSTDALGRNTHYTYDHSGNLVQVVYPDGSTERHAYDPEGNLISSKNQDGHETQFIYSPTSNLIATVYPDGSIASSLYDENGRLAATIDTRNFKTSYFYDAADRLIKVLNPQGHETRHEYDQAGNLAKTTNELGLETHFVYDKAGRLIQTKLPSQRISSSGYNALGQRTSEITTSGTRKEYTYDPLGHLVQIDYPTGHAIRYVYNELGNRTSQIDASGQVTEYAYDSVGRLIKRTLPDKTSENFSYDATGNLTIHRDFHGNETRYEYDVNNRETARHYQDGRSVITTYTNSGLRSSVTDFRGVTTYRYDLRNRLIYYRNPDLHIVNYEWDTDGNLTDLAIQLKNETTYRTRYTYDELSQINTVTDGSGVYVYTYDAAGNNTSVSFPNGVVASQEFSDDGITTLQLLAHPNGEALQAYSYQINSSGLYKRATDLDGRTNSWKYDEVNRLTSETSLDSSGSVIYKNTFAYDANGNRINKTHEGVDGTPGSTLYSYDKRNRITQESPAEGEKVNYHWDSNGDLIEKGDDKDFWVFDWSADRQLASAVHSSGKKIDYSYDADGNLCKRDLSDSPVHTFLMDPIMSRHGPLARIAADGSSAFFTYGKSPIATKDNGRTTYLHADHIGSVRTLTSEDGTVSAHIDYSAFGIPLRADQQSLASPFLFAGAIYDTANELYLTGARWLDPSIGRFISPDPIAARPAGIPISHYAYANSSPINESDPSGLFSTGDIQAALVSAFHLAARVSLAVTNIVVRARMAALYLSALGTGGISLFVNSGQSLLQRLYGSGLMGVRFLQRFYMRLPRGATQSEALRAPNWTRHPGAMLNQVMTGVGQKFSTIEWHHIVGQQQANLRQFGVGSIHSLLNLIPTPAATHRMITAFYNSSRAGLPQGFSTLNQWMATQPWDVQYRIGLTIWRQAMLSSQITFRL